MVRNPAYPCQEGLGVRMLLRERDILGAKNSEPEMERQWPTQ